MGFRAATIASINSTNLTIVGTTPAYAAGDRLFALYNGDEVNVPLTIPSDFTLIPGTAGAIAGGYLESSLDSNQAGLFKYTGNGGAGTPSSGLPSTYSFTTSGQIFPSTSLILLTWSGINDTTPTAVVSTVAATAHVTPTTQVITGCNTAAGDQVFIFVALDSLDNTAPYTFTATGYTQYSFGGDEYSPVAVLASNSFASGSPTGNITLGIANTVGSGHNGGGVMAWVVSMPSSAGAPVLAWIKA